MKKRTLSLLLALITLFAASNVFAVSEAGVLFLLISPGARAAGMGNAFVSVADDATASFWNPAGLAFQTGREVTFMHAKWLPQLVDDMSYEFFAYKQYVESLGGTLGGNITFLNLGEQVYTRDDPTPLDTFTSWDLALTLNYATRLNPNLGLGVGMRYIRSNLAPMGAGEEKGKGIGDAFAVDLGVLYHFGFIKGLRFGANLSNMGPKITYVDADQADPLPTNLRVGFGYDVINSEFNKMTVVVETNKLLVVRHKDEKPQPFYQAIFTSWGDESLSDQAAKLISSIGLEYVYSSMIFIRTGYYYDEEGKVKYPTFGAGLQYSAFRFDFGYVAAEQGHPLSDTMRFSLTAAF
jgi:hypothetical protein